MTIQKLPSGSYRVSQMVQGQRYSVTVKYKPNRTEARLLIEERMGGTLPSKGSFKSLAIKYIQAKENTLSPSTVREYYKYADHLLPVWFLDLPLNDIDQEKVQICVNEMSLTLAPKTVTMRHSFISSVLALYKPSLRLNTNLPQKVRMEPTVPSEEDVRKILEYFKESEPTYFIPTLLGCYSLRREEICALTINDIEGNIVHINKALKQDKNKNWVVSSTKTTLSTRDIPIPMDIADMIREQGYIYTGSPQQLPRALKRAENKLGLPEFSFHKLRHYFVAKMLDLGYDLRTIQEWGGWETDDTIKKVYAYSLAMKNQDKKAEIAERLANGLF